MKVEVPCDAVETKRACEHLLFKVKGPKYVRFAREATPVVTDMKTPYKFGKANVIRFRKTKPKFKDAFEHALASKYKNENEDISIIACGPSVPEAMRAAWILKAEYGIETRVLNVHTVKPLDTAAIVKAAAETGVVVTAEEHQIGGFGNKVAAAITRSERVYGKPVIVGMIGVDDRFGESGAPWELVKEFEVSAEHIAVEAKRLYDLKMKKVAAAAPKPVTARRAAKAKPRKKATAAKKKAAKPKRKAVAKRKAAQKAAKATTARKKAKAKPARRKATTARKKATAARRKTSKPTLKRKTVAKKKAAARKAAKKKAVRRKRK